VQRLNQSQHIELFFLENAMTITVTRDRGAAMRHHVTISAHTISTDLSVAGGGEDLGPSPHDLYDAALGACKALTMLYYAKRRNMPVEDVSVAVSRDDSQERAGVYKLDCQVTLTGNLSDEQRADLLRVAQKCPVHKLMTDVTTEITAALVPNTPSA
jgi:putative redox protein